MKSHIDLIIFSLVSILIVCCPSFGAEETKTPETKAVLETSKADGFKLSKKAVDTIGVVTQQVESSRELTVPRQAIVYSLDQVGIYRLRDGWFKLITVEILSPGGTSLNSNSPIRVRANALKNGDRIAIQGVPLLRVADLDAFSSSEER